MIIFNKFNGYQPDGRRLYYKGGDGGAGAARQAEADRQARINSAVSTINDIFNPKPVKTGVNAATSWNPNQTYYDASGNVFAPTISDPSSNSSKGPAKSALSNLLPANTNSYTTSALNNMLANGQIFTDVNVSTPESREKLYDEQKQAVEEVNKIDVNKQYTDAERSNRFALARQGLTGGSANIDSDTRLQDTLNEGLVKSVALGDSAAADLRKADENSKQSLISMAQSGIDTGTAQSMAMNALNATSQNALGARAGSSLSGLFSGLSDAYAASKGYAGYNQGLASYANRNPWQTSLSTAGGDSGTTYR